MRRRTRWTSAGALTLAAAVVAVPPPPAAGAPAPPPNPIRTGEIAFPEPGPNLFLPPSNPRRAEAPGGAPTRAPGVGTPDDAPATAGEAQALRDFPLIPEARAPRTSEPTAGPALAGLPPDMTAPSPSGSPAGEPAPPATGEGAEPERATIFPPLAPGVAAPAPNPRREGPAPEADAAPPVPAPAEERAQRLSPPPRPEAAPRPETSLPAVVRPPSRPADTPARSSARREPSPAPAEERATGADGRLDLSRMILLGVFGADAAPQALVRLPSGEVRRVAAGQTVGGWRVEAVGPDFVSLRSGGAARRLRLP